MSLFGAMNTAVSGLAAQSAEFTSISNNLANSQTTGYKRVDTDFLNYLTVATPSLDDSSTVVARPQYVNDVQGTITQSDNPLALAISGQGFFAVSEPTGSTTTAGQPIFNPEQYYTQAGNFTMNNQGYLVNSAGQYLNGWSVDPSTGAVNQDALTPITVSQAPANPVATSALTLAANLPATSSGTAPITSEVQVYDGLGQLQTVDLNWTQTAPNTWSVDVAAPNATSGPDLGSAQVTFGPTASGNPVPDGTIGNISGGTGTVTTTGYTAGGPAELSFTANFGNGPQTVALDLGTYGSSNGLTQYAGSDYTLNNLSQNGAAAGTFSGVSIDNAGNVVVDYSNGQSHTIAQIPVVTFAAPEALQSQNGQAFTATNGSGPARVNPVGANGAGSLVTSSLEGSNVDISSEFSHLIVAQEAYSANTKTISTASQMVQSLLNIVQ